MSRMALPRFLSVLCVSALVLCLCAVPSAAQAQSTYLGFDRNIYPGDDAMKALRKDFAFAGYWLSAPPGEKSNTWQGKREFLRSLGYGFVLTTNGRDSRDFKSKIDAKDKGTADAKAASTSAQRDGFPAGATVFVDIEEGGRLDPNYHLYLKAWAEELRRRGFVAGAYCSGMRVDEGRGATITTADDIRNDPGLGEFTFWVYNDACPPSTGCIAGAHLAPSQSGASYAVAWQYAQSPRRKQYTGRCKAKYAADGNCYAPSDSAHKWFLDLNVATSADPSGTAR